MSAFKGSLSISRQGLSLGRRSGAGESCPNALHCTMRARTTPYLALARQLLANAASRAIGVISVLGLFQSGVIKDRRKRCVTAVGERVATVLAIVHDESTDGH